MTTTAPAGTTPDFTQLEHDDHARRQRLHAADALLNAALYYAAHSWPVFPLKAIGKTPLTAHGFKDATTDLDQVQQWWQTTPQANIGTPTGGRFDVIDVDGPEGFWSLAELRHIECPADCCTATTCSPDRTHILGHPVLAVAYTGGGGRHILIPPTGQGNGTRIRPGVDYRGAGGYIVLPPSRHDSGRLYDWITPPTDQLLEQAVA